MVPIEGEITIVRPPEAIFDFVADERNEPRFNPQMLRAFARPEAAGQDSVVTGRA